MLRSLKRLELAAQRLRDLEEADDHQLSSPTSGDSIGSDNSIENYEPALEESDFSRVVLLIFHAAVYVGRLPQ
ncbi:hypothetical protein HHI36_002187 [Cryptolaemus montrouzieri]|uniref:Uncharacterized protein n=1 Tax=Cryptolaemus montrouzieri TaxID=559131 RepID=A0ABD2PAI3_9CUCU